MVQNYGRKIRAFFLKALNAAIDGVKGTTAVHICFGYAAVIHVRPEGYSFLPEFANSPIQQISIETAQSNLDCAVLDKLPGKTIILGTLYLSDMNVEKPVTVAGAHPPRVKPCRRQKHHRRARLRAKISAVRRAIWNNASDGRGCEDRAARTYQDVIAFCESSVVFQARRRALMFRSITGKTLSRRSLLRSFTRA